MELIIKKANRIAMAAALSVGVIAFSTQAIAKTDCPVEKCYGIAKKAKNDCGILRYTLRQKLTHSIGCISIIKSNLSYEKKGM